MIETPFTYWQKVQLSIAGWLGPFLLKALGMTWRVSIDDQYNVRPRRKKTAKRIYCFWHNRLVGLAYTQRFMNVGILISSHFDGEIIARIVGRMGYHPLRGSSTRGGSAGLLAMLKSENVWHLAITVDGPRGPKGVVKPGAIFLAAKSALQIVPISCDSARKWVFPSWDNFEVPKPFAKVKITVGKPITVKNITGHEQIRNQTDNLARILNEIGKCT